MNALTPRDNFFALMEGRDYAYVPFDVTMTAPVIETFQAKTGRDDFEAAMGSDFARCYPAYPQDRESWVAAFEAIGFTVPPRAQVNEYGMVFDQPDKESLGEAWHLHHMLSPLEGIDDVSQLEALPFPDVEDPACYERMKNQIGEARQRGLVSIARQECTLFESSWYLRSMEELFMDLVEGNGIADWLLDYFTRRSCCVARAACEAEADVVFLGDDIGSQEDLMMSIDFWRAHFKPRLKRVVDTVREHQQGKIWVAYHSDGNIERALPELYEIGIDIINPMQPECMPVADVIRQYRDTGAFWGMIGTQTTMPFGTADDVRAAAAEQLQLADEGARLVIAPTHVLEPDVPWENILALVETVKGIKL